LRTTDKAPIRLAFLPLGSPSNAYDQSLVNAFREGLRQVGLVENKDIVPDVVWISDARHVGWIARWPGVARRSNFAASL
jgi:hypothetical protein